MNSIPSIGSEAMTENTLSSLKPIFLGGTVAFIFATALSQQVEGIPIQKHFVPFTNHRLTENNEVLDHSSISTYCLLEKADILNTFFSKLANHSVDMKPEAVDVLNDHFWELF